ncbi:MAG: hypothetical protein G4V63_31620, partial [Candidatus Afipia apatlaquensis]|nr:hypothetical protein [Candidatus Afipia apatlaquensis]
MEGILIFLLFLFVVIPAWWIVINVRRLIYSISEKSIKSNWNDYDIIDIITTVVIPIIMMAIFNSFRDYNQRIHIPTDMFRYHTPIAGKYFLTIVCLYAYSIISFWILKKISQKLSPIVYVFNTTGLIQGIILNIILIIQLIKNITDISVLYIIMIVPLNLTILFLTILVGSYQTFINSELREERKYSNRFLQKIYSIIMSGKIINPVLFGSILPILIIFQLIIILFGQQPDSIIKAFTETSDWTLSHHATLQPIYEDAHYLCTVSLRGHTKLVKPLRYGVRHNHRIVVNRQLLIANAFENILEEYVPVIHKIIRGIYDTIGFPISKYINNKWSADLVYLLMKPLEYIFLLI